MTAHPLRDFSVIICAYTDARWDQLVQAVESVRSQTVAAREIIVVIDHNPALLERTRSQISGVTVLENGSARGLSGARNTGISAAGGEILAFMDEDAVAEAEWLERLGAAYADPRVVGVGGAIVPLWVRGRPSWFPEEFDWVVGCTYRGMPTAPAPVRNLIGCNMSFRRRVFEAIGGFRSGIGRIGTRPVGDEETEFCIRASQRWTQGIMLYEPQARVHHRVPEQRANWSYFRSRCYAEGLSKALISRLVGTRDGLASERTYTFRTLPQGVVQGLADAALGRDARGVVRASAIVFGLAVTTAGYLATTLSNGFKASDDSVSEPAGELGAPVPESGGKVNVP
jgi:glucosyl-dolichyl phosphate glucuronosyltransferase